MKAKIEIMDKNGTNAEFEKINSYPLIILSALIGGITFRLFIDLFLSSWFKIITLSIQDGLNNYSVQTSLLLPLNNFDYPLVFSPKGNIIRYLYVNF